jgi:hypothetical protein
VPCIYFALIGRYLNRLDFFLQRIFEL